MTLKEPWYLQQLWTLLTVKKEWFSQYPGIYNNYRHSWLPKKSDSQSTPVSTATINTLDCQKRVILKVPLYLQQLLTLLTAKKDWFSKYPGIYSNYGHSWLSKKNDSQIFMTVKIPPKSTLSHQQSWLLKTTDYTEVFYNHSDSDSPCLMNLSYCISWVNTYTVKLISCCFSAIFNEPV